MHQNGPYTSIFILIMTSNMRSFDKHCKVSAGNSFLCKIKYSTCKIFSVHRMSRKDAQLSAWMLSQTRTTSG